MKRSTGRLLAVLLAALTLLASGCGEKQQTPDGAPDEPLMQEKDLTIEPQPDNRSIRAKECPNRLYYS